MIKKQKLIDLYPNRVFQFIYNYSIFLGYYLRKIKIALKVDSFAMRI